MLPSERLREVESAIREVLLAPESARLVTALAPVLIQHAGQANLNRLQLQLADVGLEQRLGWLVENTLEAIDSDASRANKARQRLYRRAEVLLRAFLERVESARTRQRSPDVLDANIRSSKTLAEVSAAASPISQRWQVVTALQPSDVLETQELNSELKARLLEVAGLNSKLHNRLRLYLDIVANGLPFLPQVPACHPHPLVLRHFELEVHIRNLNRVERDYLGVDETGFELPGYVDD